MEQFTKTAYEEFNIEGRFTRVLNSGETISGGSVTATDNEGNDATDDVIQEDSTTILEQGISVGVKGGTTDGEPYVITFKAESSAGNKWQLDVEMNIEPTGS